MKKILVIMALALLTSVPAFAQATGLAVGYDQNIKGISLRYLPGGWGVEGIIGFTMTSPENDALDSAFDVNFGANFILPLATMNKLRLNGIAGVEMFRTDSTTPGVDAVNDYAIIVGAEPEYFILDNLSVSTKVGLELFFDQSTGDNNDVTTFDTFGPQFNLLDGLSIRYYF